MTEDNGQDILDQIVAADRGALDRWGARQYVRLANGVEFQTMSKRMRPGKVRVIVDGRSFSGEFSAGPRRKKFVAPSVEKLISTLDHLVR